MISSSVRRVPSRGGFIPRLTSLCLGVSVIRWLVSRRPVPRTRASSFTIDADTEPELKDEKKKVKSMKVWKTFVPMGVCLIGLRVGVGTRVLPSSNIPSAGV